jgi:hypothetical protein
MSGGHRVALGQATPEDVKTFLQEFCRTLPCDKGGIVKTITYLPGRIDFYCTTCCAMPVATAAQGWVTFKETTLLEAGVATHFKRYRRGLG